MADDEGPGLTIVLAHGAGSHMEQKTMEWLADIVREAGGRVVRFNFLYRSLGKGMPDRMPILIATYRAVIESVRERLAPETLIIGGHSMGGRCASMLEAESRTGDGLLLFGYPLHPPGQPEKLRDTHLAAIQTRTLQFNGTQDDLCTPAIMEEVVAKLDPNNWTLHWIEGADHSYNVRKDTGRTRSDVKAEIVETLGLWLTT